MTSSYPSGRVFQTANGVPLTRCWEPFFLLKDASFSLRFFDWATVYNRIFAGKLQQCLPPSEPNRSAPVGRLSGLWFLVGRSVWLLFLLSFKSFELLLGQEAQLSFSMTWAVVIQQENAAKRHRLDPKVGQVRWRNLLVGHQMTLISKSTFCCWKWTTSRGLFETMIRWTCLWVWDSLTGFFDGGITWQQAYLFSPQSWWFFWHLCQQRSLQAVRFSVVGNLFFLDSWWSMLVVFPQLQRWNQLYWMICLSMKQAPCLSLLWTILKSWGFFTQTQVLFFVFFNDLLGGTPYLWCWQQAVHGQKTTLGGDRSCF